MEVNNIEQIDSLVEQKKNFLDVLRCKTYEEALVKLDLAGVAASEDLKKLIVIYFDVKHGISSIDAAFLDASKISRAACYGG